MTDRAKKVSELTALTNATADDLLLIIDDPGGTPESKKITIANFFGNVSTNAVFKNTLTVNGAITLAGNTTINKPVTLSNTATVTGKLVLSVAAPTSNTDTGTAGEIRIDSNSLYVCINTNSWKKVDLTDFT